MYFWWIYFSCWSCLSHWRISWGVFSNLPSLRVAFVSYLSIWLEESEYVLLTCLQVFCAFSHTTNALSGRSWDRGCCLSSMLKVCAKYCFVLLSWSTLPNFLEESAFWIIQKREIYWTSFCLGIFPGLNTLKMLLQWNATESKHFSNPNSGQPVSEHIRYIVTRKQTDL